MKLDDDMLFARRRQSCSTG